MSPEQGRDPRVKQILVAGIGNAWLQDDAFGSAVARRLEERELPDGVTVMDFGTSGLDLAYELLNGYSALVLVDASRQGGEPGTLYVMEAERSDFEGEVADGENIDPHDMNPHTVLRFVSVLGGWPGRVVVIACEPGEADTPGYGLTAEVQNAIAAAAQLVMDTVAELQTDAAYERG